MRNSDHPVDGERQQAAELHGTSESAGPADAEEALEALMAACDDALARGEDPAPLMERLADFAPEARREFSETLECLRALEEQADGRPRERKPQPFGKFRLLKVLGEGGFGIVWLAEDPGLKRRVALKMPRLHCLAAPGSSERFAHEARAAAALEHPHLVPIFEIGQVEGISYLASAYCEGPSLAQWLSGSGQPGPAAVARLVEALARAAAYMHERGIVHRDLKPSNVLLFPVEKGNGNQVLEAASLHGLDGYISKITDFGLAHRDDVVVGLTRTGAVLGTPAYMAPEQAWGGGAVPGPQVDIYALGAILYELLTGRPPFHGDSDLETLRQAREEEPIRPRRLRSGTPPDLETICLKCLEKDVRQRYSSAAMMAEDLGRFLRHEPIRARPPSPLERARKWVRRRPALAAALGLSCVVLGISAAGIAWYEARDRTRQVHEESLQADLAARDYVRNFRQAWKEWCKNSPHHALEVLTAMKPAGGTDPRGSADPRGFEWYYLFDRAKRAPRQLGPPGLSIYNIALSPNGKLLALARYGGEITLWDTGTWTKTGVLNNSDSVYCVTFSPDGSMLAAGGSAKTGGGELKLYDLRAHTVLADLPLESSPGLAFSSDGSLLAAETPTWLHLWDMSPPRLRHKAQPFDGLAKIADAPARYGLIWPPGFSGPTSWVKDWVINCDGKTGQALESWHTDASVYALARSPDGKSLAIGTDKGVMLHPAKRILNQPGAASLAWRGDGGLLAAAGSDAGIYLWDTRNWQRLDVLPGVSDKTRAERFKLQPFNEQLLVSAIAFVPDGKTLISAGTDGLVKLWDASQPELSAPLASDLTDAWWVTITPDNRTVIAAGNNVRLWDFATKRELARFDDHGCQVLAGALGQDGRLLATADVKGTIRLWLLMEDMSRRPLTTVLTGHEGPVQALAISPDGRTLASGGMDGTVRLWDTATGKQLRLLDKANEPIFALAFHPGGKVLASGGTDRVVRLWDVASGDMVAQNAEDERVRILAYSPDGAVLAVGLATKTADASVMLRRGNTFERLADLSGHSGVVRSLAFSPDGSRLASGADDNLIKLWHVATGQELITIDWHKGLVSGLAFSPDGRSLASCSHDDSVRLWFAPE
jgi:WD40 repeat protein/serine/threonine protein kinase